MKTRNRTGVDETLIAMFLRMTPEERLEANDNAVRAILELRHGDKQRNTDGNGSKRDS